jgi:hypothetical protein
MVSIHDIHNISIVTEGRRNIQVCLALILKHKEGLTVDSLWNGSLGRIIFDRGKLKCLEEELAEFHFVYTGTKSSKLWYSLIGYHRFNI